MHNLLLQGISPLCQHHTVSGYVAHFHTLRYRTLLTQFGMCWPRNHDTSLMLLHICKSCSMHRPCLKSKNKVTTGIKNGSGKVQRQILQTQWQTFIFHDRDFLNFMVNLAIVKAKSNVNMLNQDTENINNTDATTTESLCNEGCQVVCQQRRKYGLRVSHTHT